ncbi:hypothetical protein HS088_TW15G01046 [Tripterygium wilfordii]|uniref:Uncharacterized protein n=2 Tax=Tripterygium wilfordii TaxID=458696 RepID=A0A7J7CNE4_TRIWF|nr:hypothetical protein HS088_TW15G01046 [Tripterygium wilfordii]
MAQQALSHSWASSFPTEITISDALNQGGHCHQFSSENISCTTGIASVIPFCGNNGLQQASTSTFSALHVLSYKPLNPTFYKPSLIPNSNGELLNSFMFSQSEADQCTFDVSCILLNQALVGDTSKGSSETINFAGPHQPLGVPQSVYMHQDMQENMGGVGEEDQGGLKKNQSETHDSNQWGTPRSIGFPFSLPSSVPNDWKLDLPWDSDSPPWPSDTSSSYSTNKCYT